MPRLAALAPRLTCIALTLALLAGCGNKEEAAMPAAAPMSAPAPAEAMDAGMAERAMAPEGAPGEATNGAPDATPKYLAERQYWTYELAETDIEPRWQAHMKLCQADCEVLGANLSKSAYAPVQAHLLLRVGRPGAAKLMTAMGDTGISERRVEREDKTMQVVDTEARLKNLAELRDRLRGLLATRSGALKDVLETERELARVQGELDAITAQRRVLANETEKILLEATYRATPRLGETGAMQPLVEAWHDVGRAFAQSLGAALLFLVQVLPWLVFVLPAGWGVWKLARQVFKRGAAK